jgi:cytochrome c oxidase cbb3-type subunit III
VAFLHQRNRDARLRFTYKILNVAVGDAAAGKTFFKEQCSSCHSPTGDLAGIATRYPGDQLQQRWIYPQPGPAPRVTVTLASGRKYSGRLEHIDEFDVSLHDAQGTYRSIALTNGVHAEVTDPLAAHYRLMNRLTDTDMHNVTTYLESLK